MMSLQTCIFRVNNNGNNNNSNNSNSNNNRNNSSKNNSNNNSNNHNSNNMASLSPAFGFRILHARLSQGFTLAQRCSTFAWEHCGPH